MFGINDGKSDSGQINQPDVPVMSPTGPSPVRGPAGQPLPLPDPVPMPGPTPPVSDIRTAYTEDHPPEKPSIKSNTADDLLQIKEQALQNLTPLVNHLGQTPEEKFKTTMMLIQASDNPQLIGEAYEAANQIEDEKTRAQALLDVVNEINYFTHQQNAKN